MQARVIARPAKTRSEALECGVTRWPVSCNPLPDELLSSWMIRLAHANGLGCESFVTLVFGRQQPVWTRDIDRSASDDQLGLLSRISGTSPSRLLECTLREVEWKVGHSAAPYTAVNGLLPLGVYHRARRCYGLMFCSECLSTDEAPYFRRMWRSSYLTCCTRHGVLLQDRCWSCGAAVAPHRVDVHWSQHTSAESTLHTRCWSCGSGLERAPRLAADEALVRVSRVAEVALSEGFADLGVWQLFAPLFFQGIRRLMQVHVHPSRPQGRTLERWGVNERSAALVTVARWLANWPVAFLDDMRVRHLSYSDLRNGRVTLPYWIDHVCRTELLAKKAARSSTEIEGMYRYVDSAAGGTSRRNALGALGQFVERARIPSPLRREVPIECYELLLAHLDQDICASFDPRERALLLADKTWLALGCVMRMPLSQIVHMTVGDLRHIARGRWRNSARAPRTMEELRFLLRCYLREALPLIAHLPDAGPAFGSAARGGKISANALSMRLRAHLVRAGLNRRVPSYSGLIDSVSVSRSRSPARG